MWRVPGRRSGPAAGVISTDASVCLVGPTLKITTKPSGTHTHVHQRVNLTCHASHFYPSHLRLTWMENRHKVQTVESPQVSRNPDGTYSLEHTWQAEATLEGSEFACWVVQDEQPPVQANITLRAQGSRLGKGGCGLSPALPGWEGQTRTHQPSAWGAGNSRSGTRGSIGGR